MSPVPKTIVFVPGAWHNPICYSVTASQLRSVGYNTKLISLPSTQEAPFLSDFTQDVDKIRSQIQASADRGHEIIIVCHSYGGLPSSQAVQGFDLATRQKQGLAGGVAHLFFCCSFIIPPGESLTSAFGGSDLPWYEFTEDRKASYVLTPAETFYNDMPPDEVEAAAAMLRPFSMGSARTKLTYAGWRDVPSTYLFCEKDQAIPIELQKTMVHEWAGERFGVKMRTETIDSSHSPFYSCPEKLTAAIRRSAGENV